MKCGVPQMHKSPPGDCLAVCRRPLFRAGGAASRVGLLLLGSLSMLIFTSSALGASASNGRHGPSQAAGGSGCVDMPTCSGCSSGGGGGGGGGGERVTKTTPVVTKTTPVVTEATAGSTETASGGVSAASPVVIPPVPETITVRPPIQPAAKAAAKKPVKKPVKSPAKKRLKKHHARVRDGASEQSFARPVLPGRRAAFTG